jgi:hypothetical protein
LTDHDPRTDTERSEGGGTAESGVTGFAVSDCALLTIATGRRARDLREFRDHLATSDPECIYHHFWGSLLMPRFENPQYVNDFAEWASHGLHDKILAERLSVIDPADFPDTEHLRAEVVEVVEDRLDSLEHPPRSRTDARFHFMRSQIIVFRTPQILSEPSQLAEALPGMSTSSVFYHFVDARRRTPEAVDDFRAWLGTFGQAYAELVHELADVDPYFSSLVDLRERLAGLFKRYFEGAAA